MAFGCGGTCAKIIVIIYNILFLMTGLVLIAVGIWLIADGSIGKVMELTYSGRNSHLFRNAGILLISMGALVFVISIIGFIGAIMENTILLGIYIAFLIIIFCGEVAGGVLAIVFKDDILENLTEVLQKSLQQQLNSSYPEQYYNEEKKNDTAYKRCYTSDIGYIWDFVQVKFKCCGVTDRVSGYESLSTTGYNFQSMCGSLNSDFQVFPISCCPFGNTTTKFGDLHTNPDDQYQAQHLVQCNPNLRYTSGCVESIEKWVEKYAPILIGIGIGFAMLELFGIIFAVCLCRNVEDD